MKEKIVSEKELTALAKDARSSSGKTRAQVARELGVARPTVVQAEEEPERSLTKLRKLLIETYSDQEVGGPLFSIKKKSK